MGLGPDFLSAALCIHTATPPPPPHSLSLFSFSTPGSRSTWTVFDVASSSRWSSSSNKRTSSANQLPVGKGQIQQNCAFV